MFNEEKFRELLIYIAAKCEKDADFGAIKLNKILFYSDFLAYKHLGQAITGAEYVALQYGPAPTPLMEIRERMIERKDIAEDRRAFQGRIVALKEPVLEQFSADEIAIIDKVIDALRDQDSEIVSELSHALLGWKAAWVEGQETGQPTVIPYGTVFVSNPPLDEFEEVYGLALAEKHGWPI